MELFNFDLLNLASATITWWPISALVVMSWAFAVAAIAVITLIINHPIIAACAALGFLACIECWHLIRVRRQTG